MLLFVPKKLDLERVDLHCLNFSQQRYLKFLESNLPLNGGKFVLIIPQTKKE